MAYVCPFQDQLVAAHNTAFISAQSGRFSHRHTQHVGVCTCPAACDFPAMRPAWHVAVHVDRGHCVVMVDFLRYYFRRDSYLEQLVEFGLKVTGFLRRQFDGSVFELQFYFGDFSFHKPSGGCSDALTIPLLASIRSFADSHE